MLRIQENKNSEKVLVGMNRNRMYIALTDYKSVNFQILTLRPSSYIRKGTCFGGPSKIVIIKPSTLLFAPQLKTYHIYGCTTGLERQVKFLKALSHSAMLTVIQIALQCV
jgi:hypothetical protein